MLLSFLNVCVGVVVVMVRRARRDVVSSRACNITYSALSSSPLPMAAKLGCDRTLQVARNSNCPNRTWLSAVAPLLYDRNMVFINAGSNKGYHVAEFLQVFHPDAAEASGWRTNRDWMQAVKGVERAIRTPCGVCRECRSLPPAVRVHAPSVQVHALELTVCNHRLMDDLFRKLRVPGTTHRMAASNQSGIAYASSECGGVGNEGSSALMRKKPGRCSRSGVSVTFQRFHN